MNIYQNGIKSIKQAIADGWSNVMTGLGKQGRDKRVSAEPEFERMTWQDVDILVASDDMAAKYVEKIPKVGTRKWIYFSGEGLEKKSGEQLLDKMDELHAREVFRQTWIWARQYGAGFVMVDGHDGQIDPAEPLDLNRLQDVTSLTALHRWELYPDVGSGLITDITHPQYGYPQYYILQPHRTTDSKYLGMRIHYSRLIRFDGARLPTRLFVANYYSHDTVLTRVYNPIRNYNTSNDSLATVMQDFRMNWLRMKNISAQLKEKGSPDLINRLQLMSLTRSITNTTILQEGEEIGQMSASLAGVKDVNDAVSNRLVAATGMPHDQVLGDGAKGGLGAEGETENRNFYDQVEEEQKENLKPQIEQLLDILIATPEFSTVPDTIKVNFHSLWQLDEKEIANMHFIQAQADEKNIMNGILDPVEVRKSRFGGDKYSTETVLDTEITAYQEKLAIEGQKAGTDPEAKDKKGDKNVSGASGDPAATKGK